MSSTTPTSSLIPSPTPSPDPSGSAGLLIALIGGTLGTGLLVFIVVYYSLWWSEKLHLKKLQATQTQGGGEEAGEFDAKQADLELGHTRTNESSFTTTTSMTTRGPPPAYPTRIDSEVAVER